MKKNNDHTDDEIWMAAESGAFAYSSVEGHEPILPNYDKIKGIGPQSVDDLMEDLKQVERDMKDPNQWDSLENFLVSFKQTHASWFR
ncbi:MAG: hypothetical protein IJ144_04010 [Prevotella sp.]|nr:hypothetical protein [Prevotella sp.]MBQ9186976.1 hypothetical protein [Prevotella sp.]